MASLKTQGYVPVVIIVFLISLLSPCLVAKESSAQELLYGSQPSYLLSSGAPLTMYSVPLALREVRTARALEHALLQGGLIYLAAGTYYLDTPLVLSHSTALIGVGATKTILVLRGSPSAMNLIGGSYLLKGLSIRYRGKAPADVVTIDADIAILHDVSVQGGVYAHPEIGVLDPNLSDMLIYGSGVWFLGDTQGYVIKSTLSYNDLYGAQVTDGAYISFIANVIEHNDTGLSYFGNARGYVLDNILQDNAEDGLSVSFRAQPILRRNVLRRNRFAGISYYAEAGGVVAENDISYNGGSGVYAVMNTAPTFIANTITANKEAGITLLGYNQSEVRGNVLEHNGLSGIYVGSRAVPYITQNTSRYNQDSGLAFWEFARGTATYNTSCANDKDGVSLVHETSPYLSHNTLCDNKGWGMLIEGEARPILDNNAIWGNQRGDVHYPHVQSDE